MDKALDQSLQSDISMNDLPQVEQTDDLRQESGKKLHSQKTRSIVAEVIKNLYMIVVIALMLFPLIVCVMGSFKDLNQIMDNFFGFSWPLHFENYAPAWEYIYPYYINSLVYAAGSVILDVTLAVLAGYAFAKLRFPMRKPLFMFIFAKMFLPGVMNLVPSFLLAKSLGILNTPFVIIFFSAGASMPYWVFVMKTFTEGIPNDLFQSMRLDGASEVTIILRLAFPMLLPMVALMAMRVTLSVWNDFVWPLVTLTDQDMRTVTIALYRLRDTAGIRFGYLFAGYTLGMLPLVVLFMFCMKGFVKGLTAGSIKM